MFIHKTATQREQALQGQVEELQHRLVEAEETLRAIHEGEVDALVVSGEKGQQIFSLAGADAVYRVIVETMQGAAFTITREGKILFCNRQFGQLVKIPMEQLIGQSFLSYVAEGSQADATALLREMPTQSTVLRLVFRSADGATIPAHVSLSVLNQPDGQSFCLVANDLSELEKSSDVIQKLQKQKSELEYYNRLMIDREIRMTELKREIDQLCLQTGQPTRYGYEAENLT